MLQNKTARTGAGIIREDADWISYDRGQVYRVEVHLVETSSTEWNAVAASLPKINRRAGTEDAVLEAIKEAIIAEIALCKKGGVEIPWVEGAVPAPHSVVRYVFVNLGHHTNGHAEARVIHTPGILGGDACIRGTRLAVWGLEHWRRLGWDDARILDAYPQLTKEDLAAAWEYTATHKDEIDEAIRENEEA